MSLLVEVKNLNTLWEVSGLKQAYVLFYTLSLKCIAIVDRRMSYARNIRASKIICLFKSLFKLFQIFDTALQIVLPCITHVCRISTSWHDRGGHFEFITAYNRHILSHAKGKFLGNNCSIWFYIGLNRAMVPDENIMKTGLFSPIAWRLFTPIT